MRPLPQRLTCAAVAVSALVAVPVTGCSPDPALGPGRAVVTGVIDGDTLEVRVAGVTEQVRLIGLDTPETVAPNRPVECFGPEASARTAELAPVGSIVLLERDVEARDRYDRLLAYVTTAEGTLLNVALVAEGFALAYPFPPNTALDAPIAAAEAGARSQGRGLWGACGTAR